jgi:hypothetical protein
LYAFLYVHVCAYDYMLLGASIRVGLINILVGVVNEYLMHLGLIYNYVGIYFSHFDSYLIFFCFYVHILPVTDYT